MSPNGKSSDDASGRRTQAESVARVQGPAAPPTAEPLSPEATQKLLLELQVHQIELELQNEELRRVQLKLGDSRARYFELFDLAPVGYLTLGQQGLILEANLTAADLLGLNRGALVHQPFSRFLHADDKDLYYLASKQLLASGEPASFDLRLLRGDGAAFWGHVVATVAPNPEGAEVVRLVLSDVTGPKQAEEALKRVRGQLRSVLESAGDVIATIDTEFHYTLFNTAFHDEFQRIYGISIQPGDSMLEALATLPGDLTQATRFWQRALAGEDFTVTEQFGDPKLGHSWYELHFSPVRDDQGKVCGAVHTVRNITDRRQAEAETAKLQTQLQQAQKMESLGILAGGVAHDMNNVLGAILGLASAHLSIQPEGSPLHRALGTICKATERGGKMVKSLLSFARQTPAENRELSLNALLREQVGLLERTTLASVRLHVDLDPELRPIRGDAGALTSAFMNLCVNAVDAMPEDGTLTLRTRNGDNDWVELVVEDTGTGMSKEVLEKALNPFFTTKEVGKGTGLGLSMVHSIMKAHRGQLTIQSEPGQGTRVLLRFPACEREARLAAAAVAKAAANPHGSLKVLLVDDDDLIQSAVQMMLAALGHTAVFPALSGEEALAMLEAGLEPELVILDMNMPGLGGIGTLPRLRVLRPALPVLLATGRIDQTALTLAASHPGVTLLPKPFGLRELQHHLENL